MKINVSVLENSIMVLLGYLKTLNIKEIELEKDYYWDINKEALYNPYDMPSKEEMTLGQLSFDYSIVEQIGKDKLPASTPCFEHVAALLNFIASKHLY